MSISEIFEKKVEKYIIALEHLYKEETRLSYVPSLLKETKLQLSLVTKEFKDVKESYSFLKRDVVKHQKEIEELKGFHWKNVLASLQSNKETLVNTAQQKLYKLLESKDIRLNEIRVLRTNLDSLRLKLSKLEDNNDRLINIQKKINKMLCKIFDGPNPPFPTKLKNEDQIEMEFLLLDQEMIKLTQRRIKYFNCKKKLKIVKNSLSKCLSCLTKSHELAVDDQYKVGSLLGFNEYLKHSNIKKSKLCLRTALRNLSKAKEYLGSVKLEYDHVRIRGGSMLVDILFDGFCVDGMISRKIERSVDDIRKFYEESGKAYNRVRKKWKEIKKKCKEKQKLLTSKRKQLINVRKEIICDMFKKKNLIQHENALDADVKQSMEFLVNEHGKKKIKNEIKDDIKDKDEGEKDDVVDEINNDDSEEDEDDDTPYIYY